MTRQMSCGFALAALLALFSAQPPAPVPDHSASGVVKFVDRTRLVITRAGAGKTPIEMTFSVNPSTQKEGEIAAGAKVQVRFRGDTHAHTAVATAILVTPTPGTLRSTSARHPE